MEGLSAAKKEKIEGEKELFLRETIERLKNTKDRLGKKIDSNIVECIAALNLLEISTAGSCGGHIEDGEDERISFPYLYFAAPNKPVYRFEREQEIREMVAKKHRIEPEDVLRINDEIDRDFYDAIGKDGYQETEGWKEWVLKNEELKMKVSAILDGFNLGKDISRDIHLRFAPIYPGFRIEAIEGEREKEIKKDATQKEDAKRKVVEAQKEVARFTEFLKRKYLSEQKENYK